MIHLVIYPLRSFLLACALNKYTIKLSGNVSFQIPKGFFSCGHYITTLPLLLLVIIFVSHLDLAPVCFIGFFMKICSKLHDSNLSKGL